MENELLKKYNCCIERLSDLRGQRRLALAGTIGGAALIVTNVNVGFFMTGTVMFPLMFDYLGFVQAQINQNQFLKKRYTDYMFDKKLVKVGNER